MHRIACVLPGVLFGLLAAGARAAEPPFQHLDGVLADRAGRTVYTYDRDTKAGGSTCNDQCAVLWPPVHADADASAQGRYTLVVRDDGRRQWAWNDKPLYYWLADRKPGDRTGDGVDGVWHLVHREP